MFYDLICEVTKKEEESKNLDDYIFYQDDRKIIPEQSFVTFVPLALIIIKKTIFSHVPLGPFENKYYFIKRKNHDS